MRRLALLCLLAVAVAGCGGRTVYRYDALHSNPDAVPCAKCYATELDELRADVLKFRREVESSLDRLERRADVRRGDGVEDGVEALYRRVY